MNYFKQRKLRKLVKHYLYEARHVQHMREDILSPNILSELAAARQQLIDAWGRGDEQDIEQSITDLCDNIDQAAPDFTFPKIRENLEIFVVAVAVAMAFRTYFIQPFKIPTGSMQPTLYGITMHPAEEYGVFDKYPLRIAKFVVTGYSPVTIKAPASGRLNYLVTSRSPGGMLLGTDVNGKPRIKMIDTGYAADIFNIENSKFEFPIPVNFTLRVNNHDFVKKDQIIATGRLRAGDHIFVNRVKYNFSRPKRGDVFVFDTSNINHPTIRSDAFYIKRCAGMPGETISIKPPYLIADGHKIKEPYPFKRLLEERDKGYVGYSLAKHIKDQQRPYLLNEEDKYVLEDDRYLPLGDNTNASLDGRYFGSVHRSDVIGPAFAVYWPPTRRLGRVR